VFAFRSIDQDEFMLVPPDSRAIPEFIGLAINAGEPVRFDRVAKHQVGRIGPGILRCHGCDSQERKKQKERAWHFHGITEFEELSADIAGRSSAFAGTETCQMSE
jgi:hypothetical protein